MDLTNNAQSLKKLNTNCNAQVSSSNPNNSEPKRNGIKNTENNDKFVSAHEFQNSIHHLTETLANCLCKYSSQKQTETESKQSVAAAAAGQSKSLFQSNNLSESGGKSAAPSKSIDQKQNASMNAVVTANAQSDSELEILYSGYEDERELPHIMSLITSELSEPYSIYTYRFFIHNWPQLCFLARVQSSGEYVGAIVCKQHFHTRSNRTVGYIAMLAVNARCRRQRIGSRLVAKVIEKMKETGCDEVVLETEITNEGALRLYENLGFVRAKRLFRYYLNGVDAYRLKLWLTLPNQTLID